MLPVNDEVAHQVGLAFLDLVDQVHDAELVGEPGLVVDLGVDAAQREVAGRHQLDISIAQGLEKRLAGMELQPFAELGSLDSLVPLEDQVADRVPGALGDHERQVDVAELRPGSGHRSDLDLEEALRLVVLAELAGILLEHVAVVLSAHQAEDRLAAADLLPELGVGGEDVALEIDAGDLELGALEDLEDHLGVAGISPLDQPDLGQLVAFLVIEPLDLVPGHPGLGGVGAIADLEVGVLLDLLQLESPFGPGTRRA